MQQQKKLKGYKNLEKEITKTISYKLQFIDGARFLARSLSNLFDNLGERIHKIKRKHRYYNKKKQNEWN